MSYPDEMIFPATNNPVTRSLIIRNKMKKDFGVKIRSNSNIVSIEPAQGFLRAGCTQTIDVCLSGDGSGQKINVYCKAVDKSNESAVRRWFLKDCDNSRDALNQLAKTLTIRRVSGFNPIATILDLPCEAVIFQAQQHPTYAADDSDTRTAHQIDSDTDTAVLVSERELLAMLPPDGALGTARAIGQELPSCSWFERIFNMLFPPEDGTSIIPPCAAITSGK